MIRSQGDSLRDIYVCTRPDKYSLEFPSSEVTALFIVKSSKLPREHFSTSKNKTILTSVEAHTNLSRKNSK